MAVKSATQTRPVQTQNTTQQHTRQTSLLQEQRQPKKDALSAQSLLQTRNLSAAGAMDFPEHSQKEEDPSGSLSSATPRMRGSLNAQGQRVGTIINTYA